MNNEPIREKYLPIGTVVLLINGTKRVMINGFCTIDANAPEKVYDYSGVLYPEGSLSSNQTLLFNHEQIGRVDHYGLVDEEETTFKEKLKELISNKDLVNQFSNQVSNANQNNQQNNNNQEIQQNN